MLCAALQKIDIITHDKLHYYRVIYTITAYRNTAVLYCIASHRMTIAPSEVNVILLGDNNVGKSSLLHRITNNTFGDQLQSDDTSTKNATYDNTVVSFRILTTELQTAIVEQATYECCHAALIGFDMTSIKSFRNVEGMIKWVKGNLRANLIILVAMKNDLVIEQLNQNSSLVQLLKDGNCNDDRNCDTEHDCDAEHEHDTAYDKCVDYSMIKDYCANMSHTYNIDMIYIKTSAKTGDNADELMRLIVNSSRIYAQHHRTCENIIKNMRPIQPGNTQINYGTVGNTSETVNMIPRQKSKMERAKKVARLLFTSCW